MDKPLNIYQRINAVRKAVPYVQKDTKVVEGGGYKAVSHDAITSALRPALIEHGIIVYTGCAKSTIVDTGKKTRNSVPILRLDGQFITFFINADDPEDRFSLVLPASAEDMGDKAAGKALSYAQKYAMLKVFNLETGDDEEGRIPQSVEPLEMISEEQAADLKAKLEEVGADQDKFLSYMKCATLAEIPAKKLPLAYEAINKKARHGTAN